MGIVIGFTLGGLIGLLAWRARALSRSGAWAATLSGGLIFGLGGFPWATLLLAFFISSSLLSRLFARRKAALSEKFSKGSQRDWGQVLANGGLGALLAIVFTLLPETGWPWIAFAGAMAAVNADTWATELGVLSRVPPRLITTGQPVAPGTSGGVTGLGTWASVAGALLIGAAATLLVQAKSLLNGDGWGTRAVSYPLLAVVGGLAGSLVDSLMGATIQRIYYCDRCGKETESAVHRCGQPARPVRGWAWLNNDLVNFLASIVGGVTAALLAWIVWR
jgi:uncharacterized protein (TIGR00297 family)